MAETTTDLRGLPLAQAYDELLGQTEAVLEGIEDTVAAMATISSLIHNSLGHLWTGFYCVAERDTLLRIGPYQGSLGCMEIEFGRGVCGTAAAERRTVIVEDVSQFPGHISCDARSRSEIVVPVFDASGALIAVLDIDSEQRAAFNEADRQGLERIVAWFARRRSNAGQSMERGYSDNINHAFAFAAKHHDRQVRKGTKLPYLTHPANVAVILTRYKRDEATVIAGILHDVVEDCVRDGQTREMLEQRIGDKFGADVLSSVLAVTKRKIGDDGVELSSDEQKSDYLARLGEADEAALWVCAADKVHNAHSILADLRRTVDPGSVWSRFSGGRAATGKFYRDVLDRLTELHFNAPIVDELRSAVAEMETYP